MTKIILTETQTQRLISELFSEKLVAQLIDRFKQEDPNIDENTIKFYIDRFQQIKNSPKVQNKDITTYTWGNLKELIDTNQPDNITIEGGDKLIYDQNNLKIYEGHTKQACVKYGTGYNFCISSRGSGNEYDFYRFGELGSGGNAIYFVIDEDKSKERNVDHGDGSNFLGGNFVDPNHLLVLMVQKPKQKGDKPRYVVTDANNERQEVYDEFSDIVKNHQPKLNGLQDLFTYVGGNEKEQKLFDLKDEYKNKLLTLFRSTKIRGGEFSPETGMMAFTDLRDVRTDLLKINQYLNKKPLLKYSLDVGEDKPVITITPYDIPVEKWLEMIKSELDYEVGPEDVDEVSVEEVKIYHGDYLAYIKKVKNILLEFLYEKNKLNIN